MAVKARLIASPEQRAGLKRINWTPYFFLAIPILLYAMWIIIPTFYTFYLSVTNWDGVSENPAPMSNPTRHYERLFGDTLFTFDDSDEDGVRELEILPDADRTFRISLTNNVRWLLVFITVPTTLGLALAMLLNTEMRFGRWYKISFYAPLVLSGPVIGLIWAWVYQPRAGLLNAALTAFGVADPPGWLAERDLAIWAIIFAAVWRQVGYVMILYLAGLKNVDPSLVEAAIVDGAGRWTLFRRVILPLLAPVTTIVIVISIIDSLRSFDLVQIMTNGGPAESSQVLSNMMYNEAFQNYNMGYAAAIAVVLFGFSLIFIGFYLYRTVRTELEY
ncbi:MAG: sugar ABC transporter permease [Anaerolineae bacterium]|nr:sugar ABC transporter permease [Anaerolineae bacterium]